MKLLNLVCIAVFLFLGFVNTAQELKVNTEKSILNWTGKAAFSSYSLTGTLKVKTGLLKVENNTITELDVSINMKTLNHENDNLRKHLRSDDFFDVKTYPEAYFKLTKPAKITNNKAILIGKMIIKGIEKKELISVVFNSNKLVIQHEINRLEYGITFNSPSIFKKMKDNAIADKFILSGELKFE